MNGFEEIELENIRRMAERGLNKATGDEYTDKWDSEYTDIFQHILDLVQRMKGEGDGH